MSLKASIPPNGYIVVADTNVMRSMADKPDCIVAKGFTDALKQLCGRGKIRLLVPSVVRDELVSQKLRLACKVRDEITQKISTLRRLTETEDLPSFNCDDTSLRAAIREKFNHWLVNSDALVIDLPISSIDWRALIDRALYREPPFEPALDDPKKENKEKGFKDALILETCAQIEADNSSSEVVLITRDQLLKEAALKRMRSKLVFEALSSFESFLAQLRDQSSEAFALELARAASEAWDIARASNLFDQLQVIENFQREFASTFANPPSRKIEGSFELNLLSNQANLRIPIGGQTIIVSSPEYLRDRKGRWDWKTDVEMSQLFQKRSYHPDSGLAPYVIGDEVRVARCSVFWNSAKFERPEIVDPKLDHILGNGIWIQPASTEIPSGFL